MIFKYNAYKQTEPLRMYLGRLTGGLGGGFPF